MSTTGDGACGWYSGTDWEFDSCQAGGLTRIRQSASGIAWGQGPQYQGWVYRYKIDEGAWSAWSTINPGYTTWDMAWSPDGVTVLEMYRTSDFRFSGSSAIVGEMVGTLRVNQQGTTSTTPDRRIFLGEEGAAPEGEMFVGTDQIVGVYLGSTKIF